MAESTKFNYTVGRLWNVNAPLGAVSTYTFANSEVFYGTMSDALGFQAYCNSKLDEEERKQNPYKIYKLVEQPDYE